MYEVAVDVSTSPGFSKRVLAGRRAGMIDGISVVWLPVSDMDKALEFYGDTLGLDIEQQEDDWSMVVAGAVRIGSTAATRRPRAARAAR